MSETTTSPALPAELRRGKTGKDGHWKEIRYVESYCRAGSVMAGMLSATMGSFDVFWGEAVNASQRKVAR